MIAQVAIIRTIAEAGGQVPAYLAGVAVKPGRHGSESGTMALITCG